MNDPLPPILADSTDEMIKLIFGGVFVLIWIVGGLMSATKKKPQTRTPEKSWDEIFRELSGEPKRPNQQQPPPPPPPVPVRFEPAPTPQQRPVPQPPPRQPVSGPPSGSAVRKKLRRKQPEVPTRIVPPPPTPVQLDTTYTQATAVSTEFIHAIASDISRTEIGAPKSGVRGAPSNATFKALHTALRPENLRHQFILTELLQPPKALREEL